MFGISLHYMGLSCILYTLGVTKDEMMMLYDHSASPYHSRVSRSEPRSRRDSCVL